VLATPPCEILRGGCETSSHVFPHSPHKPVCLSISCVPVQKLTDMQFLRPAPSSTTSKGSGRQVGNASQVFTLLHPATTRTTTCGVPLHCLKGAIAQHTLSANQHTSGTRYNGPVPNPLLRRHP
jgi:hypothetical protein